MNKSGIEGYALPEVESQESHEVLTERIETLTGIVEEFEENILPSLQEHIQKSSVIFSEEGGYDDTLKREALTALMTKLASFQTHLRAKFDSFEENAGGSGINDLLIAVLHVIERLAVAPDVRYDRDTQLIKYGGEKNVPAGKELDTYETTLDAIRHLKDEFKGVRTAVKFMHPTKVTA
jgi:hypothetical protein